MKYFFSLLLVISLVGCSTVSRDISSEYYNVGNAYYDVGDYEKAIEYYLKAMGEDDSSLNRVRYNLALAYSESGRVGEGLKHFNLLLEEDPDNLLILQSVAYAHYLDENNEEALEVYDRILAIFEYDSIALYNKALILIEEDDPGKAKELLEVLYEIDTSLEVVYQLGDLYREFELWDSYVYLFETALIQNSKDFKILKGLIEYYELEEMYFKVLEYIEIALGSEELGNSADLLFKKGSISILELSDFNMGFLSLKKAVESGFDNREQIKSLLDDERLFQAEQLEAYFRSEELY